ncbi:MAG: hypothetical protein HN565_00240 [Rhodospirillales bacterium]|nr:hypothetical protein [Rhodospirillales bacterium]
MTASDIDKESGSRLPWPKREDLEGEALAIFDRYAGPDTDSLAGLWGPGGIKLHSPKLSQHGKKLTYYLRNETGIETSSRELAILITARQADSQFEWAAHEPEGVRQGLSQEAIDVVKFRKPVDGLSEVDAVVILLGREIFGDHKVSSETYARALAVFGRAKLVDLVSIMANYAGTAALLCAFDTQLKPGAIVLPVP